MPRTPPIRSGRPSLPAATIVKPTLPLPRWRGRTRWRGGSRGRTERVVHGHERAAADRHGFEDDLVVARAERTRVGGEDDAQVVGTRGGHAERIADRVRAVDRLVELAAAVHGDDVAVGRAALDVDVQHDDVAPRGRRRQARGHRRERLGELGVDDAMQAAVEFAGIDDERPAEGGRGHPRPHRLVAVGERGALAASRPSACRRRSRARRSRRSRGPARSSAAGRVLPGAAGSCSPGRMEIDGSPRPSSPPNARGRGPDDTVGRARGSTPARDSTRRARGIRVRRRTSTTKGTRGCPWS